MWDDSPGDTDGVPRVDEITIPFSDIQFEKKIGKGAFGEVWKAQYLGTDVAVKKMFQPEDAWVRKLIKREIEALRAVRHPNVVNYMGTIHHGGDVYLITEYMEGGTLWKLLNNKAKPLPWLTRVNIAIDVARAITYLHARNIIHRDLKCRNLLIDRNIRVKVCDFGLCRETNPEQQKFMTKSGTDEWMAPEVILGNPYNAKADSFSFGMVLFEIITREKPPGRDPMRGFEVDLGEISAALPADCPPELRILTLDCVQSDQNARPSFKDIMDRLFKLRDRLKPPKKTKEGAEHSSHQSSELLPPPEPMVLPPITPRTEAQLLASLPPLPDAGNSVKRPPTAKRVFRKTVTEVAEPPAPVATSPSLPAPILTSLEIPPSIGVLDAHGAATPSPMQDGADRSSKRERRKSAKLTSSEIVSGAHTEPPGSPGVLPPPPLVDPMALPPPPMEETKEQKSKRKSEKRKKEADRAVSPPPATALPPPPLTVVTPSTPTHMPPPPMATPTTPVIPKLPTSLANIPIVAAPRPVVAAPTSVAPSTPVSLPPPPAFIPPPSIVPPPFPPPL